MKIIVSKEILINQTHVGKGPRACAIDTNGKPCD